MSTIYFIRHGQASFGSDHYDRLSELGIRQSEILGDYLVRLGLTFDAVFSGTLERQRVTAATVMDRFPAVDGTPDIGIRAGFDEYPSSVIVKAILPTMAREDPALAQAVPAMFTSVRNFWRVYEPVMRRWISGRYEADGLESWPSFRARVADTLRDTAAEAGRGKTVAVFTSAGTISAVMQIALDLSDLKTLELAWQIRNTSMSTFLFKEDRFTLSTFNSAAHLDQTGRPDLLTYR